MQSPAPQGCRLYIFDPFAGPEQPRLPSVCLPAPKMPGDTRPPHSAAISQLPPARQLLPALACPAGWERAMDRFQRASHATGHSPVARDARCIPREANSQKPTAAR